MELNKGWEKLQEIKRKDQEKVLEAWKNGELSDGSEYSEEEKQAMIDNSRVRVDYVPSLSFEYDPWVEEMMSDEK
jgi:hypothetical protein